MRVLVLGAGAVGGYFGGRLAEAGRDVTFLVRGARAAALVESGLAVESPLGDFRVPVKVTTADAIAGPYDLVLLTAKHYDLDAAVASIRPAVGWRKRAVTSPFWCGRPARSCWPKRGWRSKARSATSASRSR